MIWGESPFRFNWQTPILLSSHNHDILYMGANKLMRSMNQGNDWAAISDDLTKGGKKGNVAYGTLTAISESPLQFGLLYTGSDDGLIYMSRNGGGNWTNLSKNLPKDLWVSRIVASAHKKERVYVSLNGYRWDDFTPYLYKSNDYGTTWEAIAKTLPASSINVIREDPENENILYIGTDNGAYVSFDQGNSWNVFSKGLPDVAVHDLAVQPEAKDLILGTHGRSIYKTNISAVQLLNDTIAKSQLYIFPLESVKFSKNWGNRRSQWSEPAESSIQIPYYAATSGKITTQITTEEGTILYEKELVSTIGFNYFIYDMSITNTGKEQLEKEFPDEEVLKKKNGKYYLPVGKYYVVIRSGESMKKTILTVE